MAQSVKCLTLGFSSVCDLTVHEFKPHIELHADSVDPAWDSLSLLLSLSLSAPAHACSLSKINKLKKIFLIKIKYKTGKIRTETSKSNKQSNPFEFEYKRGQGGDRDKAVLEFLAIDNAFWPLMEAAFHDSCAVSRSSVTIKSTVSIVLPIVFMSR